MLHEVWRNGPREVDAERRTLTKSIAHALWVERKRRDVPDDPEADWYQAEQLIEELCRLKPRPAS